MTEIEFIDKLGSYYSHPSQIERDVTLSYLQRVNCNLEILFNNIAENYTYKTFPKLAVIKKLVLEFQGENKNSNFYENETVRDLISKRVQEWFTWSSQDIIEMMKRITLANELEMLFRHTFNELFYEYNMMLENNYPDSEIWRHIHYVKDCLKTGEFYTTIGYKMKQGKSIEPNEKLLSFDNIDVPGYFHD